MPKRLGETGGTPAEDRSRLKRLLDLGLAGVLKDPNVPLTQHNRDFIRDMETAIKDNPNFEPTFGQVAKAQDLYDRYIL